MEVARLILIVLAALAVAGVADAIAISSLTALGRWWKSRRSVRGDGR